MVVNLVLADHHYHEADSASEEYDFGKFGKQYQASLFQVVSESRAVTTPLVNQTSRFMVHYTERSLDTRLHRLNILDVTNSDEMQFGKRDVQFTTKITCDTVNFTEVNYLFKLLQLPAILPRQTTLQFTSKTICILITLLRYTIFQFT